MFGLYLHLLSIHDIHIFSGSSPTVSKMLPHREFVTLKYKESFGSFTSSNLACWFLFIVSLCFQNIEIISYILVNVRKYPLWTPESLCVRDDSSRWGSRGCLDLHPTSCILRISSITTFKTKLFSVERFVPYSWILIFFQASFFFHLCSIKLSTKAWCCHW